MSDKTMPGTFPKMRPNSFCTSYRSDLHCRLRNEEHHKDPEQHDCWLTFECHLVSQHDRIVVSERYWLQDS